MALFDNYIAANLKKGNNIMFIMVSSCFQVATQADGGSGGQLACAAMYYGVFSTIVYHKSRLWVLFWEGERPEKGLSIGINTRLHRVWYFQPQPFTTMVFPT